MNGRRVLLIVGGGIAAYKALELARLLRGAGVEVRAILTRSGEQFVTPLSLTALTEQPVHLDLFDLGQEAEMGHIQLSRWADLVVVAPATADLIAEAANGGAGSLATTTLLATDKAVLMAPAMNVRMWLHPATVRNVARLSGDGVLFVGPDEGAMACGEFGAGRLAEPPAILAAIEAALVGAAARPLAGKRALVTAGPTHEPIDPVRYLGNRSSGKQGYAIAAALERLGATVTLVSGPTALPEPPGVRRVSVETAEQMLAACREALPAEAAVFCAAVADWRVDRAAPGKLKKATGGPPRLDLVETPDILRTIATGANRPRLVVGFAAETDAAEDNGRAKLAAKGADWIVANDVGGDVMGGDHNAVSLVTVEGVERWDQAPKTEIARRLADRIAEALADDDLFAAALLPGLPVKRLRAMFAAAPGAEIQSGKFFSAESSSALAANAWGLFVDAPEALPPLRESDTAATHVTLEAQLPFPWAGGRRPCLDALVETSGAIIGVESKRYEPYRTKGKADVSDAYGRDVWGDRMAGWQSVRDEAHTGSYRRLDAAQLMKHALGLLTESRRRAGAARLVYVYAEPSRWGDGRLLDPGLTAEHRAELSRLAATVAEDEVEFTAISYRDLAMTWSVASDERTRRLAAALLDRFDV